MTSSPIVPDPLFGQPRNWEKSACSALAPPCLPILPLRLLLGFFWGFLVSAWCYQLSEPSMVSLSDYFQALATSAFLPVVCLLLWLPFALELTCSDSCSGMPFSHPCLVSRYHQLPWFCDCCAAAFLRWVQYLPLCPPALSLFVQANANGIGTLGDENETVVKGKLLFAT